MGGSKSMERSKGMECSGYGARMVQTRNGTWAAVSSGGGVGILVAALMCASLLGGCGEPFAFESRRGAATAPMTRLRVYAPIQTDDRANPVTRTMYDAFQASLTFRLRLCRVAVEVFSSEPSPVGSAEGSDAAPTSVLTIGIVGANIVEVRVRDHFIVVNTYYEGTLYFGLDLADLHSHQSVWSARSSFQFSTARRDDEISGSAFARGVVARLQRDGVVTSCIREAYSGCVADRHEQLTRAARIADDYERLKALQDLPECK
jgi:hypothetical protein